MLRSTPMINTARLMLCAMRPDDFSRYAEIWRNPCVVRHLGREPLSRGEAWESFLRNAGHWQMAGFGQWAVFRQSNRQMIGQAGFFYRNRGLGDDFDSFPEAGWLLAPEAQGQGFGLEAAQAAHDWFDRIMPGPLVSLIDAENHASQNLAAKLGYELMAERDYMGSQVNLLKRNGPPKLA
ncbi:GNAT family N-acetyltransferase [Ruegeria faecimaris]|uniref:Protein N-acetyltransferase, RimJ/RimL family n=2 Tax=Ruegeria faecimaris TaxID=686389 RepID=A0A521AM92_9RHOB|nr:GNAT family N-acetyltransferase [Ruegeria faecimaris]SMO35948.1 Protein N-acetyltransferase, RimJ/RimL family [Ruegeria faecimaris]